MIVLSPLPIAAITASAENLLTPSPKEVAVYAAGYAKIVVDLGSATAADTVFLGFTNAQPATTFALYRCNDLAGAGAALVIGGATVAADAVTAPHILFQFDPLVSRFWLIDCNTGANPGLVAGVVMIGSRLQAGHERGGGRQIIDTGSKELLPDGGVGGEDGVILCGLKWRFIGLADALRRQLFNLAIKRGERRPVLVVEEPDGEGLAGANERIHYGTFDRFDTYERGDPNHTNWSFSMTEWL